MGAIITATSLTKKSPQRVGQHLVWEGQITLAASYATGGDVLSAATLGMTEIRGGECEPAGPTLVQTVLQTDQATAKLKCTVSNTGSEVANTTNQSTTVVNARFVGV